MYKRTLRTFAAATLLALPPLGRPLRADPPATRPAARKPAPDPAAEAAYNELLHAYMNSDFDALPDLLKGTPKYVLKLSPDQRKDLTYVKNAVARERPPWWNSTKSATETSFHAQAWNRDMVANYRPNTYSYHYESWSFRNERMVLILSWPPGDVDNPRPAEGMFDLPLGLKKGDHGEAEVWYEMGRNFIVSGLSPNEAYQLYFREQVMFNTLADFFAYATSVTHSSPRGREAALMNAALDLRPKFYQELSPTTRGEHALLSLMLNHMLMDFGKYPHLHLPAAVPAGSVELDTLEYALAHWDKQWSFAEDKALEEYLTQAVQKQGRQVLQTRTLQLEDKQAFNVMEAQDRVYQKGRDKWVKEKLMEAVAAGRADPPVAANNGTDNPTNNPGNN